MPPIQPTQRQRQKRQRVPTLGGILEQVVDQIRGDAQPAAPGAGPVRGAGDDLPELVVRHGFEVVEDLRGQSGQLWGGLHHLVAVGADGGHHNQPQPLPVNIRLG